MVSRCQRAVKRGGMCTEGVGEEAAAEAEASSTPEEEEDDDEEEAAGLRAWGWLAMRKEAVCSSRSAARELVVPTSPAFDDPDPAPAPEPDDA